jgi:hypothetical protein
MAIAHGPTADGKISGNLAGGLILVSLKRSVTTMSLFDFPAVNGRKGGF